MFTHLAIDLGASGGRHVVRIIKNNLSKYIEVFRFENYTDLTDGHLTWDIHRIWENIKNGIIIACKKYPDIKTIGIDTWGVDYVLMNGEKEILPVYAYRDNRTSLGCEIVSKKISENELYLKTGCQFQPFNTIYQLLTDKLFGRLTIATDFLMLPEYFFWKLTGVKLHEYTNATTTGLVNAKKESYDLNIISKLDLPTHLFKKLTKPGHIEPLSDEMEKELGVYADVVLVATHDTASAVEGIDIPMNALYLSSGTWSLLGVKLPDPMLDLEARKLNFTNEGGVGYIRFQKNIMGLWIIQQLKSELHISSFEEMTDMAKISEYRETFNVDDDSLLSPKSMKKAIMALLILNKKKKPTSDNELINSVFHSLALSYKKTIDEIELLTQRVYDSICVFGGGAKNEYLNSLIHIYSKKNVFAFPVEASAIGNIKIQETAVKKER